MREDVFFSLLKKTAKVSTGDCLLIFFGSSLPPKGKIFPKKNNEGQRFFPHGFWQNKNLKV